MLYGPLTEAIDKLCANSMKHPGRNRDEKAAYDAHQNQLWAQIAEAQNELVRDVLAGRIRLEDI